MTAHTARPDDDVTAPSGRGTAVSPTRARLPLATSIGGWRIEAHIGSGPWSDVYASAGMLDGMPRRLALKVLLVSSEPELGEAALREAHALSSFRHPNLMHALAAWQQPAGTELAGAVVLLLPLAEFSLAEYLRGVAEGSFPPPDAAAVCNGAAGIADALAYLHGSRKADGSGVVVHNDVKPGNIFQVDGNWLLGDLGLASPPGGEGASAEVGSLSYLAREYLADPPSDKHPPGDVWALGVTLHRWLTGEFAFPGDTPQERARAACAGTQPLVKIDHPALRALCSAMLSPHPQERPSASAVARELRTATGQRRRPQVRLGAIAAGAALVLLGAAGGAFGYAGLAPHQPATTVLKFASYGTAKSLTPGRPVPIQAEPRRGAAVIGRLTDGTPAGIACTGHGDPVQGNWGPTSLWDRVQYGSIVGWVSDGLLYTGTNNAVAPPCHGA